MCCSRKWKSWSKSEWSWRRTSLLVMAGIALVDCLFIPMSRDVDPGRSAEGILFWYWVSAKLFHVLMPSVRLSMVRCFFPLRLFLVHSSLSLPGGLCLLMLCVARLIFSPAICSLRRAQRFADARCCFEFVRHAARRRWPSPDPCRWLAIR